MAIGGRASTTSLLGKSWRAPLPFSSLPWLPARLAFPPVPLVGFFAPLTPVMGLPPWRRLPTPSCPRRRGRRIVAHGDLENGRRHVHGFDDAPGTVPGRPDIPSTIGKHPVLMRVEKDVRRGPGRIVDRRSWNDHERRRTRELNADVHPDSYLRSNRYRDGCHEQRTEHDSLHGLLHSYADAGSLPVSRFTDCVHPSAMRFTQRSVRPSSRTRN